MKIRTFLVLMLVCSTFGQTIANPRFANKTTRINAPVFANSVDENQTLPIRRVILYSNGVSYIERRGIVSGDAEINLSFKQSQVDDVLKSMVVLDLGQGKIGAVSYNSSAPVASRMAEIPFSVNPLSGDGGGIAGVLAQLQGAKVAVTSVTKGSATGSILTVEKKVIKTEKETTTTSILVIASETGEISSFDLSEVKSVKLLDEGTRKDLNEFANATASARRRDAKTISITSNGKGQREMIVSYTIAAPIWKTTYRVVLDEAGKPFFQGWAIVDNVSEEDWQNVQLSLVSGSPVSFIQQLQKPFYRYRPVVPIPQDLQLQPQVYEAGGNAVSVIAGTIVDANGAFIPNASVFIKNISTGEQFSLNTDYSGNFMQTGLAAGNYSITVNASGFQQTIIQDVRLGSNLKIPLQVGSVSTTVNVTASQLQNLPLNGRNFAQVTGSRSSGRGDGDLISKDKETTVSDALTSGNSGIKAAATGEEIGDLFEYRIEQPVTVMRDRSALIPIIQTKMDGERVAIYNEAVRKDRPYSGVFLKNNTNLTFESGSMTVIDGDAYAGEALMERLKAKEQRLISFALDLGTLVRVRNNQDREPAKIFKIVNGFFQVHYFQTSEKLYQITNQTNRPKVFYIEYPIQTGWTLSDDSPKPDYTTQSFYRFRVELEPFADKEIKIAVRQPLMDNYQLTNLSKTDLQLFVSRRYIDEATRAKFEKLIDLRAQIAELDNKDNLLDEEVEKIEADQKRLRENIETLSKTAEAKSLIARYIAKANEQETRLEQIEKERKILEAEKLRLQREFANQLRAFTIE